MAQLKVIYTLNGSETDLQEALTQLEEGQVKIADVYNDDTDSLDYEWDYEETDAA